MRYLLGAAVAVMLCGPALAQLSGGGLSGAAGGGPAPQPRPEVRDTPPPALPGAGAAPIATTAPAAAKPATGDPTQELFTAINSNDYNSAEDAISRGADLTQQNDLGETPIDLSVALNRNSITFLLLGARNESGGGQVGAPMTLPAETAPTAHPRHHHHFVPEPAVAATPSVPLNNPGTPDPSAGFLGFSGK